MPKIRRQDLPEAILRHLTLRVRERSISSNDLILFANWLSEEPTVPPEEWFRRFPNMTVCGEGELVKTFLNPQQIPHGQEIPSPHKQASRAQIAPTPTAPAITNRPPPPPRPQGPSMEI